MPSHQRKNQHELDFGLGHPRFLQPGRRWTLPQLICNHSNSQVVISIHLLANKLDIFLGPACGKPPAPGVIFHILPSLLLNSCAT